MAEILYTNNIVDEEEEEKNDEVQPPSSLYQKMPLARCYTYSEMTTKHSYQQYTVDPCWTPLMRSWPREI
jgi:hypothetical protein